MKKKEKEENNNPLHTTYGLTSNIRYVLNILKRYNKKAILLIPLIAVCAPFMNYLWTFISKFIIDMITGDNSFNKLLQIMIVFTLIQIIFTMVNSFAMANHQWMLIGARCKTISEKNRKVMLMNFEHLENQDVLNCWQKAGNACNNNNNGLEGMMHEIFNFATSLAVVAVGLAILGTLNIFIMLIMLAIAVINFIFTDYTSRKCKKEVWDPLAPWWRKQGYMVHITTDFEQAKDIRMFGISKWLTDKLHELNFTRYNAQKKNAKLWFIAGAFASCAWTISQLALYGWLIYSVANGKMTIGNFTMYIASASTFFNYISNLLGNVSNMFARSREVDDFRSFMDFDGGENDNSGEVVPKLDSYEFTFKNVSFKYPKAEKYALKNLNITVKAGQRLAVVGLNGAGKTTFIKLLMRLYEPTEGEILLNGVNVNTYNKRSYFSIFSPIFQNVEMFAFPLSENVSMKSPEETDKTLAEKCLIDAGLGEKLASLENGVNTEILKVIHDDGIDLSGGEKQKLALARALYKNAPVVVLDEPTAALDALAESKLYQDFDKLIGDKTAIYISHRLSSTQFCSNVAMFKDGEMIEYGTHQSLLESNGAYAEMFNIQAQYYIDNAKSEVSINV